MKKIPLFFICIIFLSQSAVFATEEKTILDKLNILKAKEVEHKEKWQAKEELVKIGKEAVQPLIDTLRNENAKYYAIRALGEIKDERAVEPLSQILLDKNYGPRRYAAIALGAIKSPKAIPALQQALSDEKEYVIEDALTALQYIDPSQGELFLQKIITQQSPHGLEIKLSASEELNNITINVTFKNVSSSDYYIYWPEIYQASSLIVKDKTGRFIRSLSTVEYGYVTGQSDFHLIKAGEVFSVNIKGKVKISLPAIVSRSSVEIDWCNILYPKGPFKTINFGDTELDIGILDSGTLKFYFIYEQGETAQYWGKRFGLNNVWIGRVVSNPIEITIR